MEIVPYLPETKRGFKPKVSLYEIVNAILYKLKTGVQWEYLPIESLFRGEKLHSRKRASLSKVLDIIHTFDISLR